MIVSFTKQGPAPQTVVSPKVAMKADKPVLPNHPSILDADSVYETPNYASRKTPGLHFGQKLY